MLRLSLGYGEGYNGGCSLQTITKTEYQNCHRSMFYRSFFLTSDADRLSDENYGSHYHTDGNPDSRKTIFWNRLTSVEHTLDTCLGAY